MNATTSLLITYSGLLNMPGIYYTAEVETRTLYIGNIWFSRAELGVLCSGVSFMSA